MGVADALARGREAAAARSWSGAYDALRAADGATPLGPGDLDLLATSAYMLGREDEYLALLERAFHACLDAGHDLVAARHGFWVGMHLLLRGEQGRGTGWLGRVGRLVEGHGAPCVEQGLLLIPLAFRHEAAGDAEAGAALAGRAAAMAERFGDRDLFALAVHVQGQMLIEANRIEEGLALLDEAMVAVTGGEVAPIPTGIVFCGVVLGCQHAYEPRRAAEWTEALTRWCASQRDLVAFTGRCMTHRAEIMLLQGEWERALEEARAARERALRAGNAKAVAGAAYVEGELERLRGHTAAAEAAYLEANRWGREPQPGLALLRLAQGDAPAAAAAIRRALGEATGVAERTRLLPACVEIMLAAGDTADACAACDELERIASEHGGEVLGAIVARARAEIDLADRHFRASLPRLRRALRVWQEVGAPYETARVRELISRACGALADRDAAAIDLAEAREAFARLGAQPDLARLDPRHAGGAHGLTARELQVLRLVAAGATNRAIASELVLSERTVDRHVSNIFAKLGVSTRTAAAAYAYEHHLVG